MVQEITISIPESGTSRVTRKCPPSPDTFGTEISVFVFSNLRMKPCFYVASEIKVGRGIAKQRLYSCVVYKTFSPEESKECSIRTQAFELAISGIEGCEVFFYRPRVVLHFSDFNFHLFGTFGKKELRHMCFKPLENEVADHAYSSFYGP